MERFQRWYPVAALVLIATAYGVSNGDSRGVASDEPAGVTVTASVIMGGDSAQTPDSAPVVGGSGAPTPGAGAWGVITSDSTSTSPSRLAATSRGTARASRHSTPPPVAPSSSAASRPSAAPSCSYTTSIQRWVGGFAVTITVTNLTSAPWSNWAGSFATSPAVQQVVNSWGALYQTYGTVVTEVPESYNAVVLPGASASFGMQGSIPGSGISFSDVSVNGSVCRSA